MAHKFSELRAKMSPERRERIRKRTQELLAELPLQELRQARALSQQELAEVLTDATVERIEGGIRITFHAAVLFAFDSAELSTSAFESLDLFSESMQKYPNTRVLVVGHTDAVGEEDYNQRLSLQRAESVVDHLHQKEVAQARVDMMGKGESEPIDSNETDEGRQRNRRVELIISVPG